MPDTLLLDLHQGVQTITLNRPERLNALSIGLLQELSEAIRTTERDASVRALVITGSGRAFSSGADIVEFGTPASGWEPPALGDLLRGRLNPLVLRLRALEKPVLAAINGVAAGAGMSLALACDLRYAAESATFTQAFVNVGLVPDAGSSYYLPRLAGTSKALELAWTGELISAAEAHDLGLVNRVLPDGQLMETVQALAARLARGPQPAMRLIKRAMTRSHELDVERVLEMEAQYQALATTSADFAEGIRAFREKRAPDFARG